MKFDREIKMYLEMLEGYKFKNEFMERDIKECHEALEDESLQDIRMKRIVKDLIFRLKARNKTLYETKREVKILKSQLGEEI